MISKILSISTILYFPFLFNTIVKENSLEPIQQIRFNLIAPPFPKFQISKFPKTSKHSISRNVYIQIHN